jgi:hypothetical protein
MNDFDTLEGAFEDWCSHVLSNMEDTQLLKAFRAAFFGGAIAAIALQSSGHLQTLQDELTCYAARKQ